MKRMCVFACVLLVAGIAVAQESEVTQEQETVTTVSGDVDLLSQLWYLEDATPLSTGQVDLRLGVGWMTASAPANMGDSDDDFVITPSIVWGAAEGLELSVSVPVWVGDSGDVGAFDEDINYDTYVGLLWRIAEQRDCSACGLGPVPALALSATARVPTGCGSSGVDGELRLILTNEYESGIRSHINVFAMCVDRDAEDLFDSDGGFEGWGRLDRDSLDIRDFQYGVVIGLDGPLCADGAVRWVLDYMNRSSYFNGASSLNMLEAGWEWEMSDAQKLGLSMQIGLDSAGETPNFGASLTYAHSLTY